MKISQREARRLKKRVEKLEEMERDRRKAWVSDWPGGQELCNCKFDPSGIVPNSIRVARRLGHAVIALQDGDGTVRFFALPHAKETP